MRTEDLWESVCNSGCIKNGWVSWYWTRRKGPTEGKSQSPDAIWYQSNIFSLFHCASLSENSLSHHLEHLITREQGGIAIVRVSLGALDLCTKKHLANQTLMPVSLNAALRSWTSGNLMVTVRFNSGYYCRSNGMCSEESPLSWLHHCSENITKSKTTIVVFPLHGGIKGNHHI